MSEAEAALLQHRAQVIQQRAADPASSIWVAASAGTGKTKVLSDRVLHLLLSGSDPTRILCLTFTKAAAAEMSNRIARRLGDWAVIADKDLQKELLALTGHPASQEELTRARRLFAQVLDAPGGLKIETIHAFCQSLLARFPLEAGLPPHFRLLDERSANEMLATARDRVLASGAVSEALACVTVYAAEQAVDQLLGEILHERGRFAQALQRGGGLEALLGELYRALDLEPATDPKVLLKAACENAAFDHAGLTRAVEAWMEGSNAEREKAARLAAWLADPAGRVAGFALYRGLFLTQEGEPRKQLATKSVREREPAAVLALEAEAERLRELCARYHAALVAEASAALLRLGERVLESYESEKRAGAWLDYDDLILRCRALLERPGIAPWVLYKLDGGLDHLLIDEAQDTNPDQWAVVEALTQEFFAGEGAHEDRTEEPRTVFAVGDVKQSIYGFQRADPEGFTRMAAHFGKRSAAARQNWAKLELDVSFRSTAAVLRLVDAVFESAPARDGLLSEGERLEHRARRVGQAGLVELWPVLQPDEGEEEAPWTPPLERIEGLAPRPRLARLLARRIHFWTQAPEGAEHPDCQLASKNRRLRPGDILVLVRRRNEFVEELVRALKQLGVPVAGVDRMILTEQLAVMDLVALGRFLLLPEDDLTLATVLKGPFVELEEEALFALAHGRAGSLRAELRARKGESQAFAGAEAFLANLLGKIDYLRPYELFAELLTAGGGRRRLLERLGQEANDPVDEFLNLALAYERDHAPSMEAFLHWLEAGAQEVKRDLERGGKAVRVMTVHGAKGLEAPLVILPDTRLVPRRQERLVWAGEEGKELPIWQPQRSLGVPLCTAAKQRAAEADQREYRRLLYVALTRAEDRLIVCGWDTQLAAPETCWYRLVEQAMARIGEPRDFDLGEAASAPGWRLAEPQGAPPEAGEALPLELPEAPLPGWAREAAPREAEPPRPLAPSRPSEPEPALRSPLAADESYRFRRGLLIHRLLQSLPELPPDRRAAAAERFLARLRLALPPAERAALYEEVRRILEDPEFAALFGPDSRAEVAVSGVLERAGETDVLSGQVDRLAVTPDSVLIVDYKTNRPPPARESEVPALYRRQMAAYRALLAQIYPDRSVKCYLLWTDGPRLMQLSDALLDAALP